MYEDAMLQTVRNRDYLPKVIALIFWLGVVGAYQWYGVANGLTPLAVLRQLFDVMLHPVFGPVAFVLFYIVQPLIFFPSWLLTVSAGYLYGAVLGTALTLLASNLSALVAYGVGRFFGHGLLNWQRSPGAVQRYAARMVSNSFATVLVMRFLFLPYDVVSYGAGFLRIRWVPFLLATLIGSIPGTLAFVLFGASIEGDFAGMHIGWNPAMLALSISLFVVSLLLWRYFRNRF